MDFNQAFDRVIGNEGSYSFHPNDPGGETMWGITARVAREHGYMGAMREMPRATAREIYFKAYWIRAGADQYDGAIGFQVFDAAVNHGVDNAIRFLQYAAGVTVDGVAGAKTVAAVRAVSPSRILLRFMAQRLRFWARIADPQWRDFGRGWVNRGAANLDSAAGDMA